MQRDGCSLFLSLSRVCVCVCVRDPGAVSVVSLEGIGRMRPCYCRLVRLCSFSLRAGW